MNGETTIVALYDRREQAEAARNELVKAGVDQGRIDVRRADESDDMPASSSGGILDILKNLFVPSTDSHRYAEGVRRGGSLLSVRAPEGEAHSITVVLERYDPVDLDERDQQWRESGWTGCDTSARPETGAESSGSRQEERIPVVEEELRVGKREVPGGGVRVRSYTVETPVEKQVTLRDETVSVERRPVSDASAGASPDAFREKTVEMTEVDEEPVIAKDARVREEVVVRKDANTRTEQVSDKVRKTKVDVEQTKEGSSPTNRTASRR